jgi:hypothetical protein
VRHWLRLWRYVWKNEMSHTTTDLGLQGYKQWLKSLTPLPDGTVVNFVSGYIGVTVDSTIKPGQQMMITDFKNDCYDMVAYRNGKCFKKLTRFSIEYIARGLIDGDIKELK